VACFPRKTRQSVPWSIYSSDIQRKVILDSLMASTPAFRSICFFGFSNEKSVLHWGSHPFGGTLQWKLRMWIFLFIMLIRLTIQKTSPQVNLIRKKKKKVQ